jgi:serine/threonine-protein kinase
MPAPFDRLASAITGSYRIERELGQGGMATVYLAHDLKHDRKVAIKVLRPELAAVIGAERFLREIKTIATLQHPHILGLIDSGEANGTAWYVMPFVEGESLRERLSREKQLPIAEAVRIATETAGALDYAHRHGVIHRDIKPENILLHDGAALVADFGIALAVSAAGGSRMTETGMSLGTPHYMSPEQAMGEREITARADVYALGCVLYEMLTGDPPFTGSTAQAIVARVMTESPRPITTQRHTVPAHVEAAVLTALEKLPADRFGTAGEFAAALGGPADGRTGGPRVTRPFARPPVRLSVYLTVATVALLLALAAWGWLRHPPAAEVSRQRVVLWRHPFGQFLSPGVERHATQAAIAPDGSSIVFSDSVAGGLQLMRKLRGESEPAPIAGTEGAVSPFFSPDGAWIGYLTTDGKIRKVPVAGGGSVTVATDANAVYNAAAWLDDGTIVYVANRLALQRVSADGGASSVVRDDSLSERRRTIPAMSPLPGSRGFLYTSCPGNCAIESAVYVFDLAADSGRPLVANAAGAWYVPTGHLVYTDRAGGLFAARFDPARLALTSGPVPVIEGVVPASVAVSASGTLLYSVGAGGGAPSELVWVSRDGRTLPFDSTWNGQFEYPALSPDGRSLAVTVREGAAHLWIWRSDGTRQKLTQEGTVNWRPAWTPDGRSVAYLSNARGQVSQDDFDAYLAPVDGSAPPRLLLRHGFGLWEVEFSRDNQWLVFRSDEAGDNANIRARRLSGDTAMIGLVVDRYLSTQIDLSPDGRWLAYVSNSSGQREVYVAPFPSMASIRLISRDGGTEPRWARSGRELFFKSRNQLMAISVTPGPALVTGVPRPLFSVAGFRSARNRQQYDVSPDDGRFVMIRDLRGEHPGDVVYVENWFRELRAKVKP